VSTWVDSHCHLNLAREDPEELLRRAADAGVAWMMCPGIDAAGSEEVLRLAESHPGVVLAAAGLHPHDASKWSEEGPRIAELAGLATAVGECGLDFYRDRSPRDVQLVALRGQLALAVDLDKPAIVHCRDAFPELFAEIERLGVGPRIVVHCWTGDETWTARFAELGVTFSFAGQIAFPQAHSLRSAAAVAPPDRTMVETDTPVHTPPPRRGSPNEPANVVLVGAALAQVWGLEVDEVARRTSATADRVFRVC
jgi:TatD DNase family protein